MIEALSISEGSVSLDGQTAVITVLLRLLTQGEDDQLLNYPLQLIRENGVWKIGYTNLAAILPET